MASIATAARRRAARRTLRPQMRFAVAHAPDGRCLSLTVYGCSRRAATIEFAPGEAEQLRALLEPPAAAEITLSMDDSGRLSLASAFRGRHDATYCTREQGDHLIAEIPRLVAELRAQIAASGSTATE